MSPEKSSPTKRAIAAVLRSAAPHAYHYGFFGGGEEDLAGAQNSLQALLWNEVRRACAPQATLTVGLCGPSAASLCAAFADRQEPSQITCTTLDLFARPADAKNLDAVIIEGSYCSADQLRLLSHARLSLRPNGTLIVLSELLDDDSAVQRSALPNLSSLRQLSARLGFTQASETRLSDSARRSIEEFSTLARERLRGEEQGLDAAQKGEIEELLHQLANAEHEYSSGRRAYVLFQAALEQSQTQEYVQAEYGDRSSFAAQEVAELFEKSFGHGFDEVLWHWKYELGAGRCVAAWDEAGGKLVAHYGGAPRKIAYFGTDALAIQPCDVMVMPEQRTRYGNGSLFFKVAATFLEREIGNTVDHLLGFGFPNKKTMRLAIRLGLYEKTDDFVELRLPMVSGEQQRFSFAPYDAQDPQQQEQLERLWGRMREDFATGIIGIRDQVYLDYRYTQHPHRDSYTIERLQDSQGETVALVVSKLSGEARLLLDVICPRAQLSSVLAGCTEAFAAKSENEPPRQLLFWVTQAWLSELMIPGATVHDLGIEIPCNSWNPGPAASKLYGKWWLTAGDMDFQ